MRLLLTSLALIALVPLAAARPDLPDPTGDSVEVGPCLVGYSLYWPGNLVAVQCRDYSGDEMLWASWGTCNGGLNGATLRVYGSGVDCLP